MIKCDPRKLHLCSKMSTLSAFIFFRPQATFPLWFRQVHVVNTHSLVHVAYNMVRPLLTQQVKDIIIFHNNLETFHNYVPPEILPEEVGGHLGPFDNASAASAVYQMAPYFEQIKTYVNGEQAV